MENELFRKKSLERIASPEELHDYMRVTSPRLWMILAAIVALLAGFLVYASTATIENVMPVSVTLKTVENDGGEEGTDGYTTHVSCQLPQSKMDIVETGMTVRLGDERGKVSSLSTGEQEKTVTLVITMEHAYIPLPDGEYEAELVLESTTPISFLWN